MEIVKLAKQIPRVLIGEVVQKVRYSVKEIQDFEIDPLGTEVRFRLVSGSERSAVELRIVKLVDETCRGSRAVPVHTVWRREPSRPPASVCRALEARGELFLQGPGHVTLSGVPLALFEYFDRVFSGWAYQLGCDPVHFPAMIPAAVLSRGEYLASFPQYLTFASPLPEDTAVLEARIRDFEAKSTPGVEGLDPARNVLCPSVCYHYYPQLADRVLAAVPVRVTARANCFRYESVNFSPLERLWDYNVREILYLGTPEGVERFRTDLMAKAKALVARWKLSGAMQSANDPFFGAEATGKLVVQRLKHLKYELRLDLEDGKSSAVASFNDHQELFGRNFGIGLPGARPGTPVHSGCAGFGLERWVNAFLCQHGLDPEGWPPAIARAVAAATRRGRPAPGLPRSP